MGILKEKLKKIYHNNKLEKSLLGRQAVSCVRKVLEMIKETNSFINLIILKINYKKKHERDSGKINVVFLYQMPELWNKLESVCKEFLKDEKFNVIILAIPKEDIKYESSLQKSLEYLNCKVIDGRISENEWYDLKSLSPDYVFYQRPYDVHLPEIYRSNNVIKYSKTCYVPYGWIMTTNLQKSCLNREFFRNLYIFYAENEETYTIVKKKTPIANLLNLRVTLSLGSPSLDTICKLKNSESISWVRDRKLDRLRVMWTPRWTVDPHLCASNFFEYKDKFLQFAQKNEDTYVLLRPHPLAFENYLKVGLMSQIEIDEYKNSVDQLKNASFDLQKDYLTTFWNCDILVSDISAIMVEYFLTGKPIIYCDNGTAPLDKFTTEMSKGFYWAKSFNEIETIIMEIKNGKDRLYDKRQELIKKLFGGDIGDSSSKIVESIFKDYTRK